MTAARRIAFWITGALLALTIAGVVLSAVLLAPLDRDVVVHWNAAGEPDRWGPAWTYVAIIGGTGLLLTVIALVFALWRVRPPAEVEPPEPIELAPGEVAAWTRTVLPGAVFYWALGVAATVSIAGAVIVILATSGRGWPAVFLPIVVLVALALTAGWRVSAGPKGLKVRGLFGIPVFRVRANDIADVAAVAVAPMREFGGWGVRGVIGADGHWRTGIIVRAGHGIQVTRRNGRQFVVTVPDAATGAAVLKAYAGTSFTAQPTAG